MDAGERTELVTFTRETLSERAGGGSDVALATLGQAWAKAEWIRGGEAERQGALREIAIYRFTLLSAAADEMALTVKDRIAWNGAIYNIRERPRRLANRPETEIIAETGVTP